MVDGKTIRSVCLKISDQPEITTHPKNVTTTEGDNVTLSCDAAGNPVPTILWTKHESALSSNSRISLSPDNKQLTITNVSRTDSGEYRCLASNNLGNDTSNTANVDVQCKFSEKIVKIIFTLDNHVRFLCLRANISLVGDKL